MSRLVARWLALPPNLRGILWGALSGLVFALLNVFTLIPAQHLNPYVMAFLRYLFGAMFLLVGFTYGLFFALAGAETPGMHWTQLRLTTFDGFPPEKKHRFIRFGGACLSRCTLLGLLWSLADEECLTWQDHISLTFPTPRELDSQLIRRC